MFACIHSDQKDCRTLLVNCAYAFSPLVEETSSNTVVIDIEGCELLFGSNREIAKEIAHYAKTSGLKVNIAVAQNPDAAIHAAKCFPGISVIPLGKEATRFGDLPIEVLDFTLARVEADKALEIMETLELWGIRCFRDFAALPEAGVSERLGPEGVLLQMLARGKSDRPLLLLKPAPIFEQSIELDDPIDLIEPLSFILARLLNQLCASLQANGLAVNELRLKLKLEDRTVHERAIRLPFPMRDGRIFLKLLLLDIESHPPKCPIVGMFIDCEPTKSRSIQSGLFQPLAPEPEKLELTLARLARLVGESNVGSIELIDTHRPGAFRIKRFSIKRETNRRRRRGLSARAAAKTSVRNNPQSAIRNPQSFLGFRLFRPPLHAEVEAPQGWPAQIKSYVMGRSIRGKVIRLAGPWRTSGDWWAEDGWARDQWDVAVASEVSPGKEVLYRIYLDRRSNNWFVEGIYD
jgi:protein ImuB